MTLAVGAPTTINLGATLGPTSRVSVSATWDPEVQQYRLSADVFTMVEEHDYLFGDITAHWIRTDAYAQVMPSRNLHDTRTVLPILEGLLSVLTIVPHEPPGGMQRFIN